MKEAMKNALRKVVETINDIKSAEHQILNDISKYLDAALQYQEHKDKDGKGRGIGGVFKSLKKGISSIGENKEQKNTTASEDRDFDTGVLNYLKKELSNFRAQNTPQVTLEWMYFLLDFKCHEIVARYGQKPAGTIAPDIMGIFNNLKKYSTYKFQLGSLCGYAYKNAEEVISSNPEIKSELHLKTVQGLYVLCQKLKLEKNVHYFERVDNAVKIMTIRGVSEETIKASLKIGIGDKLLTAKEMIEDLQVQWQKLIATKIEVIAKATKNSAPTASLPEQKQDPDPLQSSSYTAPVSFEQKVERPNPPPLLSQRQAQEKLAEAKASGKVPTFSKS
jgi:hypothetical protein